LDDDRVGADRKLGAESQEVIPVERHGDVERASDGKHGRVGHPQAERRFSTANLRSEALAHQPVIAVQRSCRDERITRRDHAVATRACHADAQIRVRRCHAQP
jgi:hypothetical protein